jgi:hypothetical protein
MRAKDVTVLPRPLNNSIFTTTTTKISLMLK